MSIFRREHRAPTRGAPVEADPASREDAVSSAPADARVPPRTRAGSTWVMVCVAVFLLIALIIFVAQNSGSVEVSFLSLHGRFSLAVALLAAAAAGCVLTLVIGTTRILQLRRIVRRRHRQGLAPVTSEGDPQILDSSASVPQSPASAQESLETPQQNPNMRG
jgi:uncharacterized integral membrane protein